MSAREREDGFVLSVIKGVGTAIISLLIGVLLFAFIIKVAVLGSGVIKAVNQFLKILCIFIGCIFSLSGRMGFVKGALVGFFTMLLTYLLFALFGSEIMFGTSFYIDLLFGTVSGAIAGIIAVNVKR